MSESYHRRELEIALDPRNPAHILPPALPPSARVLDIGCGAGQTLIAAYPDRLCFGLDPDFEALRLGTELSSHVRFVCGHAEALPWPEQKFDFVILRVALPYTNIALCLREIHRVLKRGGTPWMTLHPWTIPWRQAQTGGRWKDWIFFAYIVLNSLLFHLAWKQFPFFGRYESFQTELGISRALRKNGFTDISIQRGRHLLVAARA